MPVYVINNMVIRDREEYAKYVRAFMPVFRKFEGEVVALQDDPAPLEGTWPYSRTVVLRLPSAEKARAWYESAEYQAIAVHRWNSTESNVVILPEYAAAKPQPNSNAPAGEEKRDG